MREIERLGRGYGKIINASFIECQHVGLLNLRGQRKRATPALGTSSAVYL
jgi:hypothetical protein